MLTMQGTVLNRLMMLFPSNKGQIEIGLAALLMNYSIAMVKTDNQEGQIRCIRNSILLLQGLKDLRAILTTLKALGTLISEMNSCKKKCVEDLQLPIIIGELQTNQEDLDILKCSDFILAIYFNEVPDSPRPKKDRQSDCALM